MTKMQKVARLCNRAEGGGKLLHICTLTLPTMLEKLEIREAKREVKEYYEFEIQSIESRSKQSWKISLESF